MLALPMDSLIRMLEEMTAHVVQHIDVATEEQLLEFVDQRQLVIDQMARSTVSPVERALFKDRVNALLELDKLVVAKLEQFRKDAGDAITKLETANRQKSAYQTDYIYDGLYFDKKK